MNLPPLYHYTCEHSAERIGVRGELLPAADLVRGPRRKRLPWWGELVWLTDLAHPNREALGLSSLLLRCDRTTHRYQVTNTSACLPWVQVRRGIDYRWRAELEDAPGVLVRHWFVARAPVPVVLAPLNEEARP